MTRQQLSRSICRTPVSNYFKNWGPRVGFAYSPTDKIVVRGAFSLLRFAKAAA